MIVYGLEYNGYLCPVDEPKHNPIYASYPILYRAQM
jgi:hypothetical protein